MDKKFICTSDEVTKNELLKLGFKMFKQDCDKCIFINKPIQSFDNKNLKIVYTNMLTF